MSRRNNPETPVPMVPRSCRAVEPSSVSAVTNRAPAAIPAASSPTTLA